MIVGADNKVEQRKLTLDRALGDKWLVSSGLMPGDRVIAEGIQKVRPGMVVKEVPFEAVKNPEAKLESKPQPAAKSN